MIDKEISIPIHLLDSCDYNPKIEIQGSYKVGLTASLDYFSIRDRLKVWANPKKKGRYTILNGNQRIGLIINSRKVQHICEHFNLDPEHANSPDPAISRAFKSRLKEIQADPANEKILQNIHAKVMQSSIDVQVMERLNEKSDAKMEEADARLFVGTWDRNKAKYDEAKLVNKVYDALLPGHQEKKSLIDNLLRPERAFIQPLVRPEIPHVPTLAPSLASPITAPAPEAAPAPAEDFGKWGPPPPVESPPPPKPSLIPFVLSLTPEGHKKIENHILRNSSRLFREKTLQNALRNLETILDGEDIDLQSIVCETALLCLNRRAEIKSDKKPKKSEKSD